MSQEPYAPPGAALESEDARRVPLYTVNQIFAGAILGSPFAGSLFMARNYRATGRPDAARSALLLGSIATAALLSVGYVLPRVGSLRSLPLLASVVTRVIAQSEQGQQIEQQLAEGRRQRSWWQALGLSLGIALALILALFGLALLTPDR
ncbi:MAG TPA: hypothetical protein VMR86_19190 [Myxococcota bacterium]|nr:hypothetical protein [Myxococcota bacterium]